MSDTVDVTQQLRDEGFTSTEITLNAILGDAFEASLSIAPPPLPDPWQKPEWGGSQVAHSWGRGNVVSHRLVARCGCAIQLTASGYAQCWKWEGSPCDEHGLEGLREGAELVIASRKALGERRARFPESHWWKEPT